MQILIVAVGKLRERYVAAACDDFRTRLAPYYPLEVSEVKAAKGGTPEAAMLEEGERILRCVRREDCVWLLDRCGDQCSSEELSRRVTAVANAGTRRFTLIVAGTYGASGALHERADFVWSLSKLTLLHEWARMLVFEQLYRAAKIARGEPYHH